MSVSKFDASNLNVTPVATLQGQAGATQTLGIQAAEISTPSTTISAQPTILPGFGR